MGPIPALAPLMIPIELISHFSRPVSLSIRLFSNIFAEDVLIVVIASIIPYFLPLPFMALSIFTGVPAGVRLRPAGLHLHLGRRRPRGGARGAGGPRAGACARGGVTDADERRIMI